MSSTENNTVVARKYTTNNDVRLGPLNARLFWNEFFAKFDSKKPKRDQMTRFDFAYMGAEFGTLAYLFAYKGYTWRQSLPVFGIMTALSTTTSCFSLAMTKWHGEPLIRQNKTDKFWDKITVYSNAAYLGSGAACIAARRLPWHTNVWGTIYGVTAIAIYGFVGVASIGIAGFIYSAKGKILYRHDEQDKPSDYYLADK